MWRREHIEHRGWLDYLRGVCKTTGRGMPRKNWKACDFRLPKIPTLCVLFACFTSFFIIHFLSDCTFCKANGCYTTEHSDVWEWERLLCNDTTLSKKCFVLKKRFIIPQHVPHIHRYTVSWYTVRYFINRETERLKIP